MLDVVEEKGISVLRERHQKDVRALFDRVDFAMGDNKKRELPTDERIRIHGKNIETDVTLHAGEDFEYRRK